MIWALIPAPIKRGAAWLLAGLAAFWAIRVSAKRGARQEADLMALRRYEATRERIDHADLGIGASDADRIKRLREFAGKP